MHYQPHITNTPIFEGRQMENNWISVKDRLPQHRQQIIGINDEDEPWFEEFDETEPIGYMTHWMEIKKPNRNNE